MTHPHQNKGSLQGSSNLHYQTLLKIFWQTICEMNKELIPADEQHTTRRMNSKTNRHSQQIFENIVNRYAHKNRNTWDILSLPFHKNFYDF